MIEYRISFRFFSNTENDIPENNIFRIRLELARILERCGFGTFRHIEDGRFVNAHATPGIDVYDSVVKELQVSYYFIYPIEHGDDHALVERELPALRQLASELDVSFIYTSCII